ncbi:MAG: RNA polymerase sigma factor [Gemmatimonadota bacterium]
MPGSLPPELASLLHSSDPDSREQAWSRFLARYSGLLLHTARSLGGSYDAGMDRYRYVIEELRREDFKRLRKFAAGGRSSFTTWLVVVSRHLCHDYRRARYGRDRESAEGTDVPSGSQATRRRLIDLIASELDPSTLRDRTLADPERQLRAAELSQALEAALSPLPERDRLLLKLRFEDDVPVREISQLMRFPTVFHVYRRLKAVLQDLRERMQEKGIDGSLP